MSWQTVEVGEAQLAATLQSIHHSGGQVTSSRPTTGGYAVTYVTPDRTSVA